MGDRISVQFKNGKDISIVLFNHWGGKDFLKQTQEYVANLKKKIGKKRLKCGFDPRDRLEPNYVMVDFVRHITKNAEIANDDLYFGVDENDGDNSDNGHFIINLKSGIVE